MVASVRPSVCQSTLSRLNRLKRPEKSHYQSKVFVCVSNNRTDAVDRLLIMKNKKCPDTKLKCLMTESPEVS